MGINPTSLIVTGFKGNFSPLGLQSLQAYQAADEEIVQKNQENGTHVFTNLTPECRGEYKEPIYLNIEKTASNADIQNAVLKEYKKQADLGNFVYGAFGDFISLSVIETGQDKLIVINQISQKAFIKPASATDIGVFLKCTGTNSEGEKEEKIYAVFIKRLNPPGKGKAAFIGGFNNVEIKDQPNGGKLEHFATPFETAISEGVEEAGFEIKIKPEDQDEMKSYNPKPLKGKITLGKVEGAREEFDTVLYYLGGVKTSDALMKDGGEVIDPVRGQKRVHKTDAVLALVDVPKFMTEAELENLFKEGDDAASVIVRDVTQEVKASSTKDMAKEKARLFFNKEEMGILHHEDVLALNFAAANQVDKDPEGSFASFNLGVS